MNSISSSQSPCPGCNYWQNSTGIVSFTTAWTSPPVLFQVSADLVWECQLPSLTLSEEQERKTRSRGVGGWVENHEKWQVIVEIFAYRRNLRTRGAGVSKIRLRARILMGSSSLFKRRYVSRAWHAVLYCAASLKVPSSCTYYPIYRKPEVSLCQDLGSILSSLEPSWIKIHVGWWSY